MPPNDPSPVDQLAEQIGTSIADHVKEHFVLLIVRDGDPPVIGMSTTMDPDIARLVLVRFLEHSSASNKG